MDFTLDQYKKICQTLINNNYSFLTFDEYYDRLKTIHCRKSMITFKKLSFIQDNILILP